MREGFILSGVVLQPAQWQGDGEREERGEMWQLTAWCNRSHQEYRILWEELEQTSIKDTWF